MILSSVLPLTTEQAAEVVRLESVINHAIEKYHKDKFDSLLPMVHMEPTMADTVRKALLRQIRNEQWKVQIETGVDDNRCWEVWFLLPKIK